MTTMAPAPDIEELADSLGIRILEHTGGEKGRWHHQHRIITLRSGLHPVQRRCTLAHEMGHAIHDHRSDATGWIHASQEREARIWAATTLIREEDFELAEIIVGPHDGALALELGVTTDIIRTWRDHHRKARS